MSLFKYSLLVFTLVMGFSVNAAFNDMDCLNAEFDLKVSHKGAPMGLFKNILSMNKKGCVITIEHQKMKVVKEKWIIDVCRGPVHIKEGTGSIEVLKRMTECVDGDKSDYCNEFNKIKNIIQDDGLIFAEGEKEVIESDHGKTYCSYLLIKSYLGSGMVFSRNQNYQDVLERESYVVPGSKNPTFIPTVSRPVPSPRTSESEAVTAPPTGREE